ncbi:MAG: tRNA 5-methoxyuridine(34)/uridine 5-oxyacetic acid(34) synthase CmoB [Sedimentisphaeraceae bacterium JB056]
MYYSDFFEKMTGSLGSCGEYLASQTTKAIEQMQHGHFQQWQSVLDRLPEIKPSSIDLNSSQVRIGGADDCSQADKRLLEELLRVYHPWRKGPFDVFGIHIDTEWRSDIKWDRLVGSISPLEGRRVLDVGCGNGYHCLRSAGCGADVVVGIDPFLLYVMQFQALNKYLMLDNVSVLPLGVEALHAGCGCFDTVFSMGVLYHRRDPVEHIRELGGFIADGGELVLETLIVEQEGIEVFMPQGRYAKMRNVWQLPSVKMLERWLIDAGFRQPRVVDVSKTTLEEQRKTDWMTFESLGDFLDSADGNLTVEGHPAPVRAVAVARK